MLIASAGVHGPAWVGLLVVAAVLIVRVMMFRGRGSGGRSFGRGLGGRSFGRGLGGSSFGGGSGGRAFGRDIKVRCSQGHVFTDTWIPMVSFTSIRLPGGRYQRCPVGNHWSFCRPVRDGELGNY